MLDESHLRTARVLCLSVAIGLVAMGVGAYAALGGGPDPLAAPPAWVVGAQVVAGVVLHLVIDLVGYRGRGPTAFLSATVIRMALAELVAAGSLALAFLRGETAADYVTGALVSAILLAVHVWPWWRPVQRMTA